MATTDLPARRAATPSRRRGRTSLLGAAVGPLARWVVLTSVGVFFIVPLLWLFLAPTKTDGELRERVPLAVGSGEQLLQTWSNLLSYSDGIVIDWWFRSFLYAGSATLLALVVAIPAGYALGTMRFPYRRALLWATLITMIIPQSASVIPIFLSMNVVNLTDTAWSVILPLSFFPFGVYLSYIYFATSISASLLEAARIDRAGEWLIFRSIGLPLARPLVGLLAFLSFTANWNQFFLPFVMLNSDRTFNLPVGMPVMVFTTSAFRPSPIGSTFIKRPEVALAALLLVIPVLIVFLVAQRYVTRGALTGAVKG